MKLNASKTNTTMVIRWHTVHRQSPPLTIGGTVPKESDDNILGVTFHSKMTIEKHFRQISKAASSRLGILRKSWRVFNDRLFLGFVLSILEYCPAVWFSTAYTHLIRYWTVWTVVAQVFNWGFYHCTTNRQSVAVISMPYKIRSGVTRCGSGLFFNYWTY